MTHVLIPRPSGMLFADGSQASPSRGIILYWEETHPRVHPLLETIYINVWMIQGHKGLAPMPQFEISLKGYSTLTAPVKLAGISNANYITVKCHPLPSPALLTPLWILFLKYSPVTHLQVSVYFSICLQSTTVPLSYPQRTTHNRRVCHKEDRVWTLGNQMKCHVFTIYSNTSSWQLDQTLSLANSCQFIVLFFLI